MKRPERLSSERTDTNRAEAEIRGQTKVLITIIEARFPPLKDWAQEEVKKIKSPDVLVSLAKQIVTAPNEEFARWAISSIAA